MDKKKKNKLIGQTQKATKERRKGMHCRVYEVKVTKNKLNKEKREHLRLLFLEAKWLRNAVIGSGDIFMFDDKAQSVQVKVGDEFEERELTKLGSAMKQSIVDGVKQDVFSLSAQNKAGKKVGALKFKSFCTSINLKQ
jgi:putative transposase